jgi:flagellar biosynthesis/type III secretory pathway ATPase
MRRGANGHFVLEPTSTKVGKQPAVELATSTSAVADVVTSTGMTGERFELVTHEIVFSHCEHYYFCKLASFPGEYETYVDAVRSLCKSVMLASVS